MCHGIEAVGGGLEHIGIGDDLLGMVPGRTKADFLRLIERGVEHVLLAPDELDAVGAATLGLAHRMARCLGIVDRLVRSAEHTSALQSLMRISYAVFCLKKTNKQHKL